MAAKKPWYEQLWWLIKLLVFLVSCWFIYVHVHTEMDELETYLTQYKETILTASPFLLFSFLILALSNWSLEALKWRWIIRKIENISFLQSLRAFFNGVTVSFFTPNRSGEFAGRILYLSPENRVRGALLTFISSSSQLLVTLQLGLISLVYFLPEFVEMDTLLTNALRLLFVLLVLLFTFAWLKLPLLVRWVDKLNIKSAWKEKVHVWESCTPRDFFVLWYFSLFRYIFFTTQQIIVFYLLNPWISIPELFGLSALSFLLITIIPSIALGELGVRGGVNIAVFGFAGLLSSDVLLATFTLWFVNLVLPALMGAISVLFLKYKRTFNLREK